MLYLNENHLKALDINWNDLVATIRQAAILLHNNEFSQPIKPYLRFNNPGNRIIAMPAYLGGAQPGAGIKWIASFPDNISKGIPRAHAVFILNDVATGKPLCVVNTAMLSSIRTAAVTALVLEEYMHTVAGEGLTIGINGFGPIGRMHLNMIHSLFGDRIQQYILNDILPERLMSFPEGTKDKVVVAKNWEEAYIPADIFVTCTVAKERYINLPPKKGSLQLNISLRDFFPDIKQYVNLMIVDDWQEVCRENTDIEKMHQLRGLNREDTINIGELIAENRMDQLMPGGVAMFNPMGMGVFDIAIANFYYQRAVENDTGIFLEE